jgi:hypothetical protein
VGTHRRISAAPSNPRAANADERGRVGCPITRDAGASSIDRPTDPSPWAVIGARRQFPLRCSGLRGVAARVGGFCSAAAPIFLRAGLNGQHASRVLYIGDFHAVPEPRHAPSALTPPFRKVPRRTARGATLGQGGIPMSQIAPAVGTAPARRLRRAGGHLKPRGCGSIRLIPIALFTCQSPRAARVPLLAYLRPIRAPSRGAPVGAWIRPQRTLPTTIRRAWDGLVARRVEAASATTDRRSLVSCGTYAEAAPAAKLATGGFAGTPGRHLRGVGSEHDLAGEDGFGDEM